jgi:hypothetical protein
MVSPLSRTNLLLSEDSPIIFGPDHFTHHLSRRLRDLLTMVFYPKHLALIPFLSFVTSMVAALPVVAQPCEEQTFAGAKFIVCTATPGYDDLRLFWKDMATHIAASRP